MGKQIQNQHTNDHDHDHHEMTYNKTNQNFKWGRMFHLLDYHHWHHIKKVLAHKNRQDGNHTRENRLEANGVSGIDKSSTQKITQKDKLQEHSVSAPSSPTTKTSHSLSPSPSTKSSRATRIKKMIAREVTKRRTRHRRSSTCPVSSELIASNQAQNSLEGNNVDEVARAEAENSEMSSSDIDNAEKACGLCNTMNIRCHLGDKKQVGMQGDLLLNDSNVLIDKNPDDLVNRQNLYKGISRSVSLQPPIKFPEAMNVLSMNKRFFVRTLDEHGYSTLWNNILAQQANVTTATKSLTKSGTFPINDPSCTKGGNPFDVYMKSEKLFHRESCQKYTIHDSPAPRIRFKDLRQKIKHVIKESKKDRHIIAMDAVLHRVPYGQTVPEESAKKSPCESDVSCSPDNNRDDKSYKRRSPSLDESLEKYCHLFETTSLGKEAKTNCLDKSSLRVIDDESSKDGQRRLGRMFSSPDLQLFLTNQYDNFGGDVSLRTPNRRIMSFREPKEAEALHIDSEYRNRLNENDKITNHHETSAKEDDEYQYQHTSDCSDMNNDSFKYSEVMSGENHDGDTTAQHVLVLNDESIVTSIPEDNIYIYKDTTRDPESIQEADSQPTFLCISTDEDGVKSSLMNISPSLNQVQVDIDNFEEFNYVKDILQLSGYLGTELLGTWYSSEQPVDPSIFIEFESSMIIDPKLSLSKNSTQNNNHLLLFDLINETLLAIYERSISYWCAPLSSCSRTRPMPKGNHILDEVWTYIYWYMACSKPELDPSLDYITSRDLAKDDKWMNLQFDAECVGLEVEDMVFEDLLNEVMSLVFCNRP